MMRRSELTFFALVWSLVGVSAFCDTISPLEVEAWREDLRFVRRELVLKHPDPFTVLPQVEFDAAIDTLIEHVPSMAHSQIITELAALVAAIGDGHTRLTLPLVDGSGLFTGHSATPPPESSSMMFHYLPIRLALFEDGLYVREIDHRFSGYLGAKVVRIGGLSAEDAMKRVSRVIHHDNEWQLRSLLPSYLVIPELLEALGVTENPTRAEFTFSVGDNGLRTLVLDRVPRETTVEWADMPSVSGEHPLYLRHLDRNFWFEPIENRSTVFCQYNEVSDEADESIAAFSTRLTNFIMAHSVQVLVLDLRFNRGGDNSLNRSFLHALIRCPALQEPGSLYVIIGRNTFSAAMMFAIDLEKHTSAIFLGEPTGAKPNHFGDSRKLRLPHTGLTLRVSTLYWQYSGPKDHRPWLAPQIPTSLSSDDYRNGRDPALERILGLATASADTSPEGKWAGRSLGYDIVLHLEKTNGSWEAAIDFPGEDATGLPLKNVRYDAPSLGFDFPNGDETIHFDGQIHDQTIIGRVVWREQVYPWVMLLSN